MLKQWLIDYSHDVLNGDIVACQKHKWACERFLKDVQREGTVDFPFLFDEERALKFLKWMRLFKHRKGVLAGQRIEPHPIQVFVFSNIYGWIHKDTKLRRFKKGYWQVGRKNAKSQSLGCVGSYEASAFGEPSAEIYCAATKKKQSKLVWTEIEKMIENCEELKGKFKVAYGIITHIKSDSVIEALSKEDKKTGDGTSPQCFIVDEYHAHETAEMYDIGDSGTGARSQSLMMIITTAGFHLNHPCYSVEYKYVSSILDPNNPIENDEYFVMVNELDKGDDIKDESVWEKANPILCSYEEGRNYLKRQLKAALDVPEKMRTFLTKNMNVWVDAKDNGYMPMNKWAECSIDKHPVYKGKLPDLKGKECYVGIDLSKKIDLTSVSFEFPLDDGAFLVLSHSFLPEDTLEAKRITDKVPYDLWVVNKKWITATPGEVVDYRYIMDYIMNQAEENGWIIREICYDPHSANMFAQYMMDEGYTMVEIRQGTKTLSEPTKHFRELVFSKKMIHNNNPVLTWSISNAVTRQDHNENIMLDKDKSTQRIDPIASLINAHVRAMLRPKAKRSIYEDRGIMVL
jgi:phage terminase large subunit-like protein